MVDRAPTETRFVMGSVTWRALRGTRLMVQGEQGWLLKCVKKKCLSCNRWSMKAGYRLL